MREAGFRATGFSAAAAASCCLRLPFAHFSSEESRCTNTPSGETSSISPSSPVPHNHTRKRAQEGERGEEKEVVCFLQLRVSRPLPHAKGSEMDANIGWWSASLAFIFLMDVALILQGPLLCNFDILRVAPKWRTEGQKLPLTFAKVS